MNYLKTNGKKINILCLRKVFPFTIKCLSEKIKLFRQALFFVDDFTNNPSYKRYQNCLNLWHAVQQIVQR